MNLEACLEEEIKKVCPIEGISFGDLNNKSTWHIHFKDSATQNEKDAALNILNNFVWDDKKKETHRKKHRDENYVNDLLYKKTFIDYKVNKPDATFSDFMNYLESINI